MTRKLLCVLASVVVLLPLAGCSGDSAKKAKIESFTANPTIVPTAGGEVTLTWQVTGAEKIEIFPDIGVVTGSSLSLVVTETTEFELVAKRDGTSRRKRATVTVTEPNMVVGTVRSMINAVVVPDAIVVIAGHDPAVTDANGMFAIPDVATPYQLSLVAPGQAATVVYAGLTRFDPTIDYPLSFGFVGTQRQSTVEGTIAQAVVPAGIETSVSVDTSVFMAELLFGEYANIGTGAYSIDCPWTDGPTSVPATVRALRNNTTGPITTYMYGTASTTLVDGDTITGVNVTLTSSGLASTAFTYTNFDVYDPEDVLAAVLLGTPTGTSVDEGFALPDNSFTVSVDNDIIVTAPNLAGASLINSFQYSSPLDGSIAFDIRTVPVGSPAQVVTLAPPPRLLLPVEGGDVTEASSFAVSGHPQAVKLFFFQFTNGDPAQDQFVMLVTTEDSIPLPDLKEIGLDYNQMTQVQWTAFQIGPRSSIDDVAGPGGVLGNSPEYIGLSEPHTAFFPTLP